VLDCQRLQAADNAQAAGMTRSACAIRIHVWQALQVCAIGQFGLFQSNWRVALLAVVSLKGERDRKVYYKTTTKRGKR